jgi:hypothetical protein
MNDEANRLQAQRDELNRQMQRDELNRQMQRDELNRQMQRDELNRLEAQRLLQAEEQKKWAANRCVNNDGTGVMGGLCVACYVAMRAEEARAEGRVRPELVTQILADLEKARSSLLVPGQSDNVAGAKRAGDSVGPGVVDIYASAYARNFDKTPQLERLWDRAKHEVAARSAARGRRPTFSAVRSRMWTLVNNDPGEDAQFVRNMLSAAGFVGGTGDQAPMLSLEYPDPALGRRYSNVRRLSIDHEVPQSRNQNKALDADNLRFMPMDDNLRRGNKYGKGEVLYGQHNAEFHRRSEVARAIQAEMRNREAANRCANNDGPALIGGLCVACYAAERAEEARLNDDKLRAKLFDIVVKWASRG